MAWSPGGWEDHIMVRDRESTRTNIDQFNVFSLGELEDYSCVPLDSHTGYKHT